ncbi:metalloprotease TldD [Gammaproteobacteria bacterium]|nr:metalloprotease TldD [Gammaproteobacteria bacterium]
MTSYFDIAKKDLLDPAGITDHQLQNVLGTLLGNKIDNADLYFQSSYSESWFLEDGIIKGGSYNIDRGVGVRAMSGEKTGFAYSDDIFLPALEKAASAAKCISQHNSKKIIKPQAGLITQELYSPVNPLKSISENDKILFLQKLDIYTRKLDSKIIQVNISLSADYETILVMDSVGHLAADVRPLVRLNISVVVEYDGKREQGYAGGGGRYDYKYFLNNNKAEEYARDAVHQALINLEAVNAPAGVMPVVLGPGWPGVLLHEAVGHGLEGDFNRKGSSVFAGRMGEKVASSLCTIVDDGTLKNRRGSLNIDDEGTGTKCTVLIENGILKNYMQDKRNARLMGVESTGNGRRESYAHLPMPRMTNTYMLNGKSDPGDIISSVKKGIYAVNFGGGQVDITSGKFVFSANEAYLIENGKVTRPVKGATLVGNGIEVMNKISMVGNDSKLDSGVGICGKDGQSVPVGVGQPTLLIEGLTVGGTNS